eukprot:764737-Hanusia_phi.AAC.4
MDVTRRVHRGRGSFSFSHLNLQVCAAEKGAQQPTKNRRLMTQNFCMRKPDHVRLPYDWIRVRKTLGFKRRVCGCSLFKQHCLATSCRKYPRPLTPRFVCLFSIISSNYEKTFPPTSLDSSRVIESVRSK